MDTDTNQVQLQRKSARNEPHVMVDIVDPAQNGHSAEWKMCVFGTAFIEAINFILFAVCARKSIIIYSVKEAAALGVERCVIVWGNVALCFVIAIFFVIVAALWYVTVGTQEQVDHHKERLLFNRRIRRGIERFSKYGKEAAKQAIVAFTGILHFDRESGITTEKRNVGSWTLKRHPYQGEKAYNVMAIPRFTEDDEIIIDNLQEATKALGPDHLVSTSMISGQNVSCIMDDVLEQLKEKNLSKVRERALTSVYNKFKDRAGSAEPVWIIHFGLPPAVHDYESIENMRRVREEFELALNEYEIDTVLIKDPEDLAMIINRMLSGLIPAGGKINEF